MELNELKQLAAWLQASDIECIEIARVGESVRMSVERSDRPLVQAAVNEDHTARLADADSERASVVADSVGLFLATHPLRPNSFVRPGDSVKQGDIVGLLRIGRIYAPVMAPVDGIVTAIRARHEMPVGFGTCLMDIRPASPSGAAGGNELSR